MLFNLKSKGCNDKIPNGAWPSMSPQGHIRQ